MMSHTIATTRWRIYFSDNPHSLIQEEEGVYYDNQGILHCPQNRSQNYWTRSDIDALYCCLDFNRSTFWGFHHYHHHHHHENSCCGDSFCGDSGTGDAGEICGLIMLAIAALTAAIMAFGIVFNYPPMMIFSWILLVGASFTNDVVEQSPVCTVVRAYDNVSAVFILVYFITVCIGVSRVQRYYKGYFPGTPGVKVDVDSLIQLFKTCKNGYSFSIVTSIILISWGIADILLIKSIDSCRWTTITQYGTYSSTIEI